MKRRIYLYFLALILPAILLLSALLSMFFWNAVKDREMASVRDKTWLVADLYNRGTQPNQFEESHKTGGVAAANHNLTQHDASACSVCGAALPRKLNEFSDYVSGSVEGLRMTIISSDGAMMIDNLAPPDTYGNRSNRAEVRIAMEKGIGEAVRFSDTLKANSYYYAVRLQDGNILRLSKTIGSIVGAFKTFLPVVLAVTILVMLLADFLARRLTKHIIKPLSNIDFEGENVAVYDELLPYVRKINEQKREITSQMATLKSRTDTISTITNNMKEGLILLDNSGTILAVNKAMSDIFGDIVKKNILYVHRDLEFQQKVRDCFTGKNAEIQLRRNDKIYNVYFSPVFDDTRIRGAVILFFDATEYHKAEKQRKEFSANVSHELKTPLTSISALAEMIENGMATEPEAIKGFASNISDHAKRLQTIIEDIIKLSEFDEAKTDRSSAFFDLYSLAENVVKELQTNDRGVKIDISGEHFDVFANRRMIYELLSNLIDNGIRYNRDGGTVTVALSHENGLCKIVVSDTGIGIPAEHHSRMFERFYRVDSSRSKKTGGTGLGLAIVKHIAEYHGGRAELESSEGEGTTVTCWIRMRPL